MCNYKKKKFQISRILILLLAMNNNRASSNVIMLNHGNIEDN